MALRTYAEVRPWAKSIQEAVGSRVMPPWHAAPGAAHQFRNDRALSQKEIETITSWVDSGSPEGKMGAVPQLVSGVSTWKIGKPDFVVQVPGLQVAKEGVLPYTFLIVPTHFEKDTWVRAAEFRIDQRATVHHMNVFVREPGSSYLADFPRNQIFVPTVTERGKKRAGEADCQDQPIMKVRTETRMHLRHPKELEDHQWTPPNGRQGNTMSSRSHRDCHTLWTLDTSRRDKRVGSRALHAPSAASQTMKGDN